MPPSTTASPKTLFWTNLFIFLFLAPPTSPISSSPRAPGCFLFKKDLKRAYRQIPVNPRDYDLLGYQWNDLLYFDLVLPFGLRSATLACQRTINAIAHIFYSVYHYQCVNYIDDFGGVEASLDDALEAFQDLETLLNRLGLESSPEKDCPPSTRMVFLGLIYDTATMTLEVPEDKLSHASALIRRWLSSHAPQNLIYSHSLANFPTSAPVSAPEKCSDLRRLPHKSPRFTPSSALLADLRWWNEFLAVYNGVSLLRSSPWIDMAVCFSTDAHISGIGIQSTAILRTTTQVVEHPQ